MLCLFHPRYFKVQLPPVGIFAWSGENAGVGAGVGEGSDVLPSEKTAIVTTLWSFMRTIPEFPLWVKNPAMISW